MIDGTTAYVILVVFVATLIRSALGFGEALFAVPLLALLLPLQVAAPLAVLISITIAAIIVVQDWQKIHLRSTGWLVFATLFGIPLGLLLLTSSHQRMAKMTLAIVLLAFSVYSLFGRKPLHLKTDSLAWLFGCGFFAGILGGAYGMNGPPLAIYGAMRRWSPQHFRATLARILSSGKHFRYGRILVRGLVGACRHALLPGVVARDDSSDFAWQAGESSPARRNLFKICLLRPRHHRGCAVRSGFNKLKTSPRNTGSNHAPRTKPLRKGPLPDFFQLEMAVGGVGRPTRFTKSWKRGSLRKSSMLGSI